LEATFFVFLYKVNIELGGNSRIYLHA
jgi:hypothetical protein